MSKITRTRCFHHPIREAVARCPSCRRFFCRECIAEHQGQVLCAACLRGTTAKPPSSASPLSKAMLRAAQWLLGIAVGWLFFYYLGSGLLLIPVEFHEGTIWKGESWESE